MLSQHMARFNCGVGVIRAHSIDEARGCSHCLTRCGLLLPETNWLAEWKPREQRLAGRSLIVSGQHECAQNLPLHFRMGKRMRRMGRRW